MKINLMDLDSARSSRAPAHLSVSDVIKRLLWPLEQNHGGSELCRSEVLWPVCLMPIDSHRRLADKMLDLVFRYSFVGGESLGKGQVFHLPQSLAVIVGFP